MDKHGAGEDELLDFEFLELSQQPLCTADSHLLVLWVGLAGQVKIGGEVNHRSDAVAIGCPHTLKRLFDALVGS